VKFFKQLNLFCLIALLLSVESLDAAFWGFGKDRSQNLEHVWEYPLKDFSEEAYFTVVSAYLDSFESQTGKSIKPGVRGYVGLKIDTHCGAGLETSVTLVRAMQKALIGRGYKPSHIIIVDVNAQNLRDAGYLPPLSQVEASPVFNGSPVLVLDSDEYWSDAWFYESALPVQFNTALGQELLGSRNRGMSESLARKSFLCAPFIEQVDFWINLPVVTHHPVLQIDGVLSNATLWSVSNRERFFNSPTNVPVVITEIAAIPEYQETWAFTLLSFERFQFIGGPKFNSLYTRSLPKMIASANPVILDRIALDAMNDARIQAGFNPIDSAIPLFAYAEMLELGTADPAQVTVVSGLIE
jgi:hypothetical protein